MVLSCHHLQKSFGGAEVLQNITFTMESKEKAAIVGVNGAGKTTLFRLLTGDLPPDGGVLSLAKDINIGYMAQTNDIQVANTIYEEVLTVFQPLLQMKEQLRRLENLMSQYTGKELEKAMAEYSRVSAAFEKKDGYAYESRAKGVIKGLGFSEEDWHRKTDNLSGGEKTRISLGKLLLTAPDLLLLDEPTNHLDLNAVQWLENYLETYQGSILLISHDRYFINKIARKIIEIENGKSTVYQGNYQDYALQKEKNREIQYKQYVDQQKEIRKQEESIRLLRSFNREKTVKRAESKEKQLAKIDKIEKPENLPDQIRFSFAPIKESGKDVLEIKEISKSFKDNLLFRNVSFYLKKGEKVALIGPNGIGKTTLFRILLGQEESGDGEIHLGANVKIGYYDQQHMNIDGNKTILNEIWDAYPKLTVGQIRNVLAAFTFYGDDVYKTVDTLSGGEKGRVSLAKMMLSGANFLLLDEPTNHLDIYSKEVLEGALRAFEGTVLYISHDRYFINHTAEKVIELTPSGIQTYLGNYDFYLEHKALNKEKELQKVVSSSAAKENWLKNKETQAEIRKKQANLKKTEEEIAQLETKLQAVEKELATEQVATNPVLAQETFEKKTGIEKKLEVLYENWVELSQE